MQYNHLDSTPAVDFSCMFLFPFPVCFLNFHGTVTAKMCPQNIFQKYNNIKLLSKLWCGQVQHVNHWCCNFFLTEIGLDLYPVFLVHHRQRLLSKVPTLWSGPIQHLFKQYFHTHPFTNTLTPNVQQSQAIWCSVSCTRTLWRTIWIQGLSHRPSD